MTKQAVLHLCHQSYRSLKSYHGTSDEVTRCQLRDVIVCPTPEELNDPPAEMLCRSRSEVWFASPNQIRFEDNTDQFEWETELGCEEVVCDGHTTWTRSIGTVPGWENWRKVEIGPKVLCVLSGTSGHAGTAIPILLLEDKLRWPIEDADSEADVVYEAGRALWRVHGHTGIGEATYWVDRATGLLVRAHSLTDPERMGDRAAALERQLTTPFIAVMTEWDEDDWNTPQGLIALETTEAFTLISRDEDLPASLFARPDGAPE